MKHVKKQKTKRIKKRTPFFRNLLILLFISLTVGLLIYIVNKNRQGSDIYAAGPMVAPGTVSDITWGTSTADIDRTVTLLQQTGVKWIRANISWNAGETNGKGQYHTGNFATYDYAIQKAHAAGIRVLMPISDAVPYWASADPNKTPGNWNIHYKPSNYQDYVDFVVYVVNRYKAMGVHYYEVWNEPNHPTYWPSGINAAEYTNSMLKPTYQAIHQADPEAKVLLGGLTQGAGLGAASNYYTYLQQVYSNGGQAYFDIANFHMYPFGDPTQCWNGPDGKPALDTFCSLNEIRNIMTANGDGSKEVWLTEMGWSTCTPTNTCWGVTEAQQADYMTKAFTLLNANYPYIPVVFQYNFRDNYWRTSASSWGDNTGMLRVDYTQKPAYTAYKNYATTVTTGTPAATSTPSVTTAPTATPTRTPTPIPSTTPTADNTPPTVSLTSPAHNSFVARNTTITLRATAADNVRVTKVEFYVGSTRICTDTSVAYTCSWKVPNTRGVLYWLSAVAFDPAGNISKSFASVTSR